MDDEEVDEEDEEDDEDAIPEEYDGVGFSHETTLSSIAHQRTRHRQRQFQRSISEEDGMLPAHDVDVEGPSDIEEEVEHDEQVEVDEEDEEGVEIEPEAGSESEMLHERGMYTSHSTATCLTHKLTIRSMCRKIPNSPPS